MDKNHVLAALRIYLGAIFALAVYPKLVAGPAFTHMLTGFVTQVGLQNAHPFYQRFLAAVVLPHVTIFAPLVVIAETLVALALITGTATRAAGILAMLLLANYMLSKGLWWWNPSSNDGAFLAIALVLVLTAAGRTLGVDAYLVKRWPNLIVS